MAQGARLQLALFALLAYCAVTAVRLRSLSRPSLAGLTALEDTPAGNGTRYEILRSASAARGAFMTVRATIRPGAPGFYHGVPGSVPLHSHAQEESITVKEGTLSYVIGEGAAPKQAGPGETIVIPAGTAHSYHNPSEAEAAVIEAMVVPAPPLGDAFFESLAGLGQAYGGPSSIHPLQLVLLMRDAGVKVYGLSAPFAFAQDHLLPHLARALGFRSVYPEFRSGGAAAYGGGGGGGARGSGGDSGDGGAAAAGEHEL